MTGPTTQDAAQPTTRTEPRRTGRASSPIPVDPLWYKDAIIYEVHVRAFADSNGDGIGDFQGLTNHLDYLQQLGVNTIWVLPFYPSPLRDGGYDIAEYTSINPDYGTMRDFTRFVREAHDRGMRVITELVVNHTSDQHPWFQRARRAPKGSAARDWYVWSDTDEKYAGTRIIFTDTETSNWAWDPVAGQYYWHRFFSHQPDLNYENPQVRRAITRVMQFWFDKGVDGMRLDATPYLCEREGTNNENLPETHEVIKEWRAFVDERYEDKMLLAEANQWPDDVRAYFGDGDECHMAFHFPVMPRLFMALRQEDRQPIVDILARTPDIPETSQWALFLRNHDELTLEMVTDEERDYMYSIYAADPRMRINVGIRRRLAPLLDNNRRAIELLHALLFSLPGTPILYYGDELGMGDNVFLGDRDGVRTPMQWNGDRNAGFSRADPASLYLPTIQDPLYGYQAVNVEAQERSASSLLNWMRRMVALRSRRPAFGRGDLVMLHPENRAVLAFLRIDGDVPTLIVANLSRFAQAVELDLSDYAGRQPVEVIGQQSFPPISDAPYVLTVGPHGFYWFDLTPTPVDDSLPPPEDMPTIEVSGGDWRRLLEGDALEQLEREVLPAFLERQRWFGRTDERVARVRLHDVVPLHDVSAAPTWIALADAERGPERDSGRGSERVTYTLALGVTSGRGARQMRSDQPEAVIAELRSGRGTGLLYEAMATEGLVREVLDLIENERSQSANGTRLAPWTHGTFDALYESLDTPPEVHRNTGEQSNTSVRVGQQFMLKAIRQFEPAPHPETEVGRHLADDPGPTARLVGSLSLDSGDTAGPIIVAHEYTWSRQEGWDLVVSSCLRFLDEFGIDEPPVLAPRPPLDAARDALRAEIAPGASTPPALDLAPPKYGEHIALLGKATGELHRVLAEGRGDPAFEPEPLAARDLDATATRIRRRLRDARGWLRGVAGGDDPRNAGMAQAILDAEGRVGDWLRDVRAAAGTVDKIRIHGDYHLGQVLDVDGRFVIIDFGGEVGLPIEERRKKASVFADVAGMLRSFSYAGLTARASRLLSLPEGETPFERLSTWVSWWEERATLTFLAAYLEEASGASFLPGPDDDGQRLLDLYLLDKALHELQYEMEYRPEWAFIPLEGLAAITARLGAST
ncbi:MAG: maltose alpha-D-glucosyltransferase [Dehalococcoidia bacterium]|nr:maltose alpha-D-glucosyltransferase [Dehalococcoidia bacterium]